MLEEVMRYINNRFEKGGSLPGKYAVEGGFLEVPSLADGQWFWVEGSALNDGLHQYPAEDLQDEEFVGRVVPLAVPRGLVDLADEIEAWCDANAEAMAGPYQSESFGGYSYTKASSLTGAATDAGTGWQSVFGPRLRHWRKLSSDWV